MDTELALKLNKLIRNECKEVPHDIGIRLEEVVRNHKPEMWQSIESDFIKWDNETHSNASQRQILDWFKERFV